MPSASEFDPELYRDRVLEPARKLGGILPRDLLLRYAVSDDTGTDPQAFAEHIARIVRHWRALKQKRVYQSIAAGLLAAHADLAASGNLSYSFFAQSRSEDQASARRSLDRLAADLAATTSVVPRSTVASLGAVLHGRLGPPEVEEALRRHRITVVERDWPLPDPPSAATRSILATNLAILGLALAPEAVFGVETVRAGFRLRGGFQLSSGARLTRDLLTELKKGHAKRALDERKTAQDNVLAIVAAVVDRPAQLDALLLWQLVDVLQPQVTAGLPVRAIAAAAADLGLDRTEAAELALTMGSQAGGLDPIRAGVQGSLNAGELFTARQRAVALPEDDELRQRIEIEMSRVEALIKEADEAHRTGTTETEAELLSRALAIAGEEAVDLRSRLQSLAPPAPVGVVATVKENRVHLTWLPAPARTGDLRYRVLRGVGSPALTPGAGSVLDQTQELHAMDANPPYGDRLHYTVFASRGGDVWSAGAQAPAPVVVLPEVRYPELETRNGAILGSWRMPAGAADVLVSCQPGSAPEPASPGRRVAATAAGFHDLPADAGVRYYYRISAVYVGQDGQRRISPGVVEFAILEVPMDGVQTLDADLVPGEDPLLMLRWVPPERGSVMIYRHQVPPPWRPGTSIQLDDLSRQARPVAAAIQLGAEHEHRLTTRAQEGRNYFTAMTVGVNQALVGASVSVTFVSPIRQLVARRDDDRVRLRWTWPDGIQVCRVQWWPESPQPDSAPTLRVAECGRRRYHDDGGLEIAVGRQPTVVSVVALRRDGEGETASPATEVTVPGRAVTVRYVFRRSNRLTPWRGSRLILTADRPCRVPPLIVVRSPGRVMPLRAESGTEIFRTPALDLTAGRPLALGFTEPAGSDQTWLGCFFADGSAPGLALVRAEGGT